MLRQILLIPAWTILATAGTGCRTRAVTETSRPEEVEPQVLIFSGIADLDRDVPSDFTGEVVVLNEDGQKTESYRYEVGALNGACRAWNEEGVLVGEGRYRNGLKHGHWLSYNDVDGSLEYRANYVDGRLHGPQISYDRDGTEAGRLEYRMGEPWDGHFHVHTPDGYVSKHYRQGKLTSTRPVGPTLRPRLEGQ